MNTKLAIWLLAIITLLIGSASIIFHPWGVVSTVIGLISIICGIALLVTKED
jgi:hypothetical protein